VSEDSRRALALISPSDGSLDEVTGWEELRTLIPDPKKRAFLAAFSIHGNRSRAGKEASVGLALVNRWIHEDAAFGKAYDLAREASNDALEMEARRRAVEGWEEPIYGKLARGPKGEDRGMGIIGYKRVFSDTMLAMMLNGNLPNKYRRNVSVTGPDGGPIQVQSVADRLIEKLDGILARRAASAELANEVRRIASGTADNAVQQPVIDAEATVVVNRSAQP
jgi:hypothetical protein